MNRPDTQALMYVSATLGQLTQSWELCEFIPDYLQQTFDLTAACLVVVSTAPERPTAVLFRKSTVMGANGGHAKTQSMFPLTLLAASMNDFKLLASDPGATVVELQLDQHHHMMLILHFQSSNRQLDATHLDLLQLTGDFLAHGLRILLEWYRQPGAIGNPFDRLNSREWPVMLGLCTGDSEKTLADQLHISPHTFHSYVKAIYRHLGVQGRMSAVKLLERTRRAWWLEQWNLRKETIRKLSVPLLAVAG